MVDLLNASLELMIVGMAIVFLFLAMLVVAINLMSKMVRRYFPEIPPGAVDFAHIRSDDAVTAAIAAAIHRYRASHKGQ